MVTSITDRLLGGLQSYTQSRLQTADDSNTIKVGNQLFDATTGQPKAADTTVDTVNLSPDAQKALAKIKAMADHLDTIQGFAGGRKMTDAEQYQVSQLTSQLDSLYGAQQSVTSEAFLYLSDDDRTQATTLLKQADDIYSAIGTGGTPTAEQSAALTQIVSKLDKLLDEGNVRASNNIADLPAAQQQTVMQGLLELGNLITSATNSGGLSDADKSTGVDLSNGIDAIFAQYGTAKPVKTLTASEQAQADQLLGKLGDIFAQAGQGSIQTFLLNAKAQNSAMFISLISGQKDSQQSDIFSLNSGNSSNTTTNDLSSFLQGNIPSLSSLL